MKIDEKMAIGALVTLVVVIGGLYIYDEFLAA